MLFGDEDEISGWQVADNVAEKPEREFEIDPSTLFAALRAERGGGAKIIGYWHSHPSGDASPSMADAQGAAPDGKLWLISGGQDIIGWRSGPSGMYGRFTAVDLAENVDG